MKQLLIRGGAVCVEDVPAPQVESKSILVRTMHSCISVGTELSGVRMSGLPLYRRALKQPDNLQRVLRMVRDEGVGRTLDRVRGKLAAGAPTGYSAAGRVIDVGSRVDGFVPGDLVACAGAGIANHAEVICVPVNLAVRVPQDLDTAAASTVTLGAIALQGIRRANPTLGETVLVVGLGILGQLTAQMLRANGCRVIGADVDDHRIQTARAGGMHFGVNPGSEDYVQAVHRWTDGFGADAAIITAATASHDVVRQAMQACRKKGRVVLVGDVGLNLVRADLYAKELDFLISCSYGPGRYDPSFEEQGIDYPIAYVRWTETRNMEAYLRLLADRTIDLGPLIGARYAVDDAQQAYAALAGGGVKPLSVLLEYPQSEAAPARRVELSAGAKAADRVRVGIAGAGGFATGVHAPNLAKLGGDFALRAVMSRTGSNAKALATQYQAAYATTDYAELLSDPEIDLVIIGTRHDLHGPMVLAALEAGKHVFVEKPLCLTDAELEKIRAFFVGRASPPVLMTGFNRRFSPAVECVRGLLKSRVTPMIVDYRMNAGFIPRDHWVHGAEGGGRNIGEACHIYDLFVSLTGAAVRTFNAQSIRPTTAQWGRNDNFCATVSFQDGSVCTLTYTGLGNAAHPKERMEIFADGKVVSMEDYRSVHVAGAKRPRWSAASAEKGQFQELQALARALRGGAPWPIPLEQQIEVTRLSFDVERQLVDA